MTRQIITVVVLSLTMSLVSLGVVRAAQVQALGQISGTVMSQTGEALANMTVQLRDLSTLSLVGTTTTNAAGQFVFVVANPGSFIVEILGARGAVVGVTAPITLAAGAMVATGVTVAATAAGVAGGVAGGLFGSTVAVVAATAAGLGVVAGAVVAKDTASSSR
jgi:hypothetical protein